MTDGEKRFCDKQYGRSGGFFTSLFEAIMRADSGNLDKLELAFPEEVRAYRRFSTVDGYWQKLEHEYLEDAGI